MNAPSLSLAPRPARLRVAGRRLLLAVLAPAVLSLVAGCAVPGASAAGPLVLPGEMETPAPQLLPAVADLTTRLAAISHKKIDATSFVVTTTDAAGLADRSGSRPMAPASTMKVFTTMAAVSALGADKTFATTVVDAGGGRLILVGGGDPLLTDKTSGSTAYRPASLQKLAAATAAALKASGRTTIALGYDSSLFSGPTFSPFWKKTWKPTEAKVTALEINAGKDGWKAQADPPRFAASAFAARLKKAGITVTGIKATTAPKGATQIAAVQSASVGMIIKRTLKVSDNVAAETLSRHAALAAGAAPSFAGASAVVTAWAKSHNLWAAGQVIHDGSGLSPSDRLTAASLAGAIRLALSDPGFAPVIAGLPVAGRDGTLARRFDDPSEKAGVGNVRAKTGTLRGVAGLVGYLTACGGQTPLVFAELDAGKSASYDRLYDWLDRTAAAMITTTCG